MQFAGPEVTPHLLGRFHASRASPANTRAPLSRLSVSVARPACTWVVLGRIPAFHAIREPTHHLLGRCIVPFAPPGPTAVHPPLSALHAQPESTPILTGDQFVLNVVLAFITRRLPLQSARPVQPASIKEVLVLTRVVTVNRALYTLAQERCLATNVRQANLRR